MEKFKRPKQPDWFISDYRTINNKVLREKLKNLLLEITNNHCSYTDKLLQKDIAQIDWFIPKTISNKVDWNNLYIVYPVTDAIKMNNYNDLLIRPDSEDYDFEKYFDIDFDTHHILVNKNATIGDQKRAKITIELLGLNHESIVDDRKQELNKYFQKVIEVAELKKIKDVIYPEDHEELYLNNYSYRFYFST